MLPLQSLKNALKEVYTEIYPIQSNVGYSCHLNVVFLKKQTGGKNSIQLHHTCTSYLSHACNTECILKNEKARSNALDS